MKTKVIQKPGREIIDLTLEYVDLNDATNEIKEVKLKIQEPNFEEVCEAYKYMHDDNGKPDYVTPGKLILDLCALEYDEILLKKHQLMLSVCGKLTGQFVHPILTDIKKKD